MCRCLGAFMSVHDMHACLRRSEKGVRSLGTAVTDGCKTLWVPGTEPGPLEKQPVLVTTELSVSPALGATTVNGHFLGQFCNLFETMSHYDPHPHPIHTHTC